jgi:Na+/proline symporter
MTDGRTEAILRNPAITILLIFSIAFLLGYMVGGVIVPQQIGVWNLSVLEDYRNYIITGAILMCILIVGLILIGALKVPKIRR